MAVSGSKILQDVSGFFLQGAKEVIHQVSMKFMLTFFFEQAQQGPEMARTGKKNISKSYQTSSQKLPTCCSLWLQKESNLLIDSMRNQYSHCEFGLHVGEG
jgi:hypothetical protein